VGGLVACTAREPAPSADRSASLLDTRRISLINARPDLSRLPAAAVPLNTSDPRYAGYFAESVGADVIPISVDFTCVLQERSQ
jgi:hypothetical protein